MCLEVTEKMALILPVYISASRVLAKPGVKICMAFNGEVVQHCDSQPLMCSSNSSHHVGAPQLGSIVIRAHPHTALPLITYTE